MKRREHKRLGHSYDTTPDGAVLSLLHRIGSDMSKPLPTNFYLYFNSRSDAASAASELTDAGFSVALDHSAGDRPWLCLASKKMIPEGRELASLRRKFSDLAKRLGGEYDGWESEVSMKDDEKILHSEFAIKHLT